MIKYAKVEEILEVKMASERMPYDLDFVPGDGFNRLAALGDAKETEDGFLYVRCRAISSRVNKNNDGWPSEELAKSYKTFIGRPIFVDHNNDDPSRARGVIVDSRLHVEEDDRTSAFDPYYASAPDNHRPPTWIELLLEVDAKTFPKLAQAVRNGQIDAVSMGANIETSVCSVCSHSAKNPLEYCDHVSNKGAEFEVTSANGEKMMKRSYEDCHDITFFEISFVFDPADPTALISERSDNKLSKVAEDGTIKESANEETCTMCGNRSVSLGKSCSSCGKVQSMRRIDPSTSLGDSLTAQRSGSVKESAGFADELGLNDDPSEFEIDEVPEPPVGGTPLRGSEEDRVRENRSGVFLNMGLSAQMANFLADQVDPSTGLLVRPEKVQKMLEGSASEDQILSILSKTAGGSDSETSIAIPEVDRNLNYIPQSDLISSPAAVDTLKVDTQGKETRCPNCQSDTLISDSQGMLKCPSCSWVQPPQPMDNPDLGVHLDIDLIPDGDEQELDGEKQQQVTFFSPLSSTVISDMNWKIVSNKFVLNRVSTVLPKKKVLNPSSVSKTEDPQNAKVVADQKQPNRTAKVKDMEKTKETSSEGKLLVAFSLADEFVSLGLVDDEHKLAFVAKLEEETTEALEARKSTLALVKEAGFSRPVSKVAQLTRVPKFAGLKGTTPQSIEDAPFESIFM